MANLAGFLTIVFTAQQYGSIFGFDFNGYFFTRRYIFPANIFVYVVSTRRYIGLKGTCHLSAVLVSNSKKVQRNVTKFVFFSFASEGLVYTIINFDGSHFFLTNSNTKTHSSFVLLIIYSVQFTQFEIGSVTHDPCTFSSSRDCSVNHI